jgi:hypothetical protein
VAQSLATWVSELADDVVSLSESYAAWHFLAHPEERAPYAAAIDRYSAFLVPTTIAHFQFVAVSIFQLTDKRADALSIPQVLNEARTLWPAIVRDVETRLAPSRQIFERIASIRLKVYAHRDKNVGPEMIFREANLSPELIGSCVSLLEEAVDALAAQCIPGSVLGSVVERAFHAAELTRADLRRMLAAL